MVRREQINQIQIKTFCCIEIKTLVKTFLYDDMYFLWCHYQAESIPCFSSRGDILENYSDYGGRHLLSGRRDIIIRTVVVGGRREMIFSDISEISSLQCNILQSLAATSPPQCFLFLLDNTIFEGTSCWGVGEYCKAGIVVWIFSGNNWK